MTGLSLRQNLDKSVLRFSPEEQCFHRHNSKVDFEVTIIPGVAFRCDAESQYQ